jgi:hypothetical protein
MAGNKTKTKKNTRQTNPLAMTQRRVPRPVANFNGSTLHGMHFATRDLSAVNSASHNIVLDCGNTFSTVAAVKIVEGLTRDLSGIPSRFLEYRITSVTMKWVPHVAPGVADAGSSITIGYIDNPEAMVARIAALATDDITVSKGLRNVQTFNAWQGFTYKVPVSFRRKWFSVNSNASYTLISEVAESVQGLVVWGIQTISAAVDVGAMHSVYNIELRGLNSSIST